MKSILLTFIAILGLATTLPAANIVIMTVVDPDNYDAPNTMRDFAEKELKPLGHHVTIVEGDKPEKHHFDGLVEALKDADLLVLFSRRRFPPKDQMAAIRAHLDAGKPLLGIRTANHAFIPKPKEVVDPSLAPWPEFTHEVLGGENTGYETKGLPYSVSVAADIKSPLLEGVNAANIRGHQSLYKVLPLADNATPILIGTAQAGATTPPQPVAWTRSYGANKARIFYTSLGAPEDMQIADVRRLLLNAVAWTLQK
ncbi:ThuA domain-containing protein [Prosthecobacter sp.]|uniref:ThuA domain-containing protein n=1 Tax=Prosthecobacter sp. TaxID=1965333 RepID=UPI001DF849AB|nr:ThuA domain-containing protein [Prosthecobacter sp.]MCB1275218.1 ThuA domain-containing protein [Prosthecobacter sp.]